MDPAKIESIRKAIESGSYRIDFEKMANHILASEKEFAEALS
ncbi:flagellar biosynthesis anti-sigma factor FlgM [Succinimonas sp.]